MGGVRCKRSGRSPLPSCLCITIACEHRRRRIRSIKQSLKSALVQHGLPRLIPATTPYEELACRTTGAPGAAEVLASIKRFITVGGSTLAAVLHTTTVNAGTK